jgi:hypothetical protein
MHIFLLCIYIFIYCLMYINLHLNIKIYIFLYKLFSHICSQFITPLQVCMYIYLYGYLYVYRYIQRYIYMYIYVYIYIYIYICIYTRIYIYIYIYIYTYSQGGYKEYGYKNNVIAILQVILSPQSPSTQLQPSLPSSQSPVPPPNPSLQTDDLFLKDSVSWFLHFLRPTLLRLMHSVNQTPLQIIAPTFVKTPDLDIYGKKVC